jgi:hypothetical protein
LTIAAAAALVVAVPANDAAVGAPVGSPFTCTADLYWMQGAQLMSGSPQNTPFGVAVGAPNPTGQYDSIGYNVEDNFLYGLGYVGTVIANQLVRVDASGTATPLGIPAGLPAGAYNAGTMDDSGNLWVSLSGDLTLYQIDVSTNTMVRTVVPSQTPATGLSVGADIVWRDGSIIRLLSNTGTLGGRIMITDLDDGTATVITSTAGLASRVSVPPSLWLTSDDRLFASNNSGAIVELINWQTTAFRAQTIATGATTSKLDGASSQLAPSPFGLAAWNDDYTGTPLVASAGGVVGSIWSNDLYNAGALDPATVTTTLTSAGGLDGATLGSDGAVTVPAGFAPGRYTLGYSICQIATPTVCAQATISVLLAADPSPGATPAAIPDPELAVSGANVPWWVFAGAAVLVVLGAVLAVLGGLRRSTGRRRQP